MKSKHSLILLIMLLGTGLSTAYSQGEKDTICFPVWQANLMIESRIDLSNAERKLSTKEIQLNIQDKKIIRRNTWLLAFGAVIIAESTYLILKK